MTPKGAKAVVDSAFRALQRACDGFQGASELFVKAHVAATEEEKSHRRYGRVLSSEPYRNSVETTARYFVVRDYLQPASVQNALDAASIKRSSLYSAALRVLMPGAQTQPAICDVLRVDYADDIAQPAPDAPKPRARRARRARGPSEWQREEAMQLGMGLGVEAYNDAMGWGEE